MTKEIQQRAREMWNEDRIAMKRKHPAWWLPAWSRAPAWQRRPYLKEAADASRRHDAIAAAVECYRDHVLPADTARVILRGLGASEGTGRSRTVTRG